MKEAKRKFVQWYPQVEVEIFLTGFPVVKELWTWQPNIYGILQSGV